MVESASMNNSYKYKWNKKMYNIYRHIRFVTLLFLLLSCCKQYPNRLLYKRDVLIKSITVTQTDGFITISYNVKKTVTGNVKSEMTWHFYKHNGLYYTNDYGLKKQLIMSNAVKRNRSVECLHRPSSIIKSILMYVDNIEKETFCSQIYMHEHSSCPSILIRYDKFYNIENIYVFSDSLDFYPVNV